MLRVLVIGSGGREHALVWKISQSRLVDKVFCAPGNAGIAQNAECLDIKPEDIGSLAEFAVKERMDLTVVGPEAPLSLGIVNEFAARHLRVFGPSKAAARMESSKVFSKELMRRYGVPTAEFKVFEDADPAKRYVEEIGAPCVIKADGLAAGKGVVVAKTIPEAHDAISQMLESRIFGEAGNRILVEECLEGEEASILVLTDSRAAIPLAPAQDHKRIFDGDQGPNTGGMGAYCPAPVVDNAVLGRILNEIVYRAIGGLNKEGINYSGVLYAGVMLTKDGPKALEFNVRFGDPETQAILPRIKSDIVEVMLAVSEERLSRIKALDWDERSCVCVVCASGGYPGEYQKGKEISGLEAAACLEDTVVFHAGTKMAGSKEKPVYLTSGGRVLGVTALGYGIADAIKRAYRAADLISFEGMQLRRDIGKKALRGLNPEK